MLTFNNIAAIIILLGVFQAFFLALVISQIKYGNLKANRLISLFCFCTSGYLIRGFILSSGFYLKIPLLVELTDNFRYLLGPILYFYIKVIITPDLTFRKRDLIHLIPLALNLLFMGRFYFGGNEYQVQYLLRFLEEPAFQVDFTPDYLSRFVFFLVLVFYVIGSMRAHQKYKEVIRSASPFGGIYLSWIRLFTYSFFSGLILLIIIFGFGLWTYPLRYLFISINLFVAFLVFFCGFKVFMQPEILYMAKPLKFYKKYNTSCLTLQEVNLYFDQIKLLMDQEKAYINPDLNLMTLAKELSISKNYMSQIINEKAGKSFNDFVNGYRIEKIKALLKDPSRKNEKILTLALEVGFNSKAPFNKAFKKFTGESPIAFRKKYMI